MSMLEVLMRAEEVLPKLLSEPGWNSLDVDYHPPRVERLWRPFDENYRLFLHRIHPCRIGEALFHPHPWPSAMRVLLGTYWTKVGSSPHDQLPPVVYESIVTATPDTNYRYSMEHPDGWHAVVPVGHFVYTVMVTGRPWKRPIPTVTEVAKAELKPLAPETVGELLSKFHIWYGGN